MLFSACDQSKPVIVCIKRVTPIANYATIFQNPREPFSGIDIVGMVAHGKYLPSPTAGTLRCSSKMVKVSEERLLRRYRHSESGL